MDDKRVDAGGEASAVESPRYKLEIEWLYDYYDCEDCGMSDALGAIVRLNGAVIAELIPQAQCFSSTTYDESEVYATIFNILGIDLEFTDTEIRPPMEIMREDDDDNKDF